MCKNCMVLSLRRYESMYIHVHVYVIEWYTYNTNVTEKREGEDT